MAWNGDHGTARHATEPAAVVVVGPAALQVAGRDDGTLAAYVALDGFDFGVGMWYATRDDEHDRDPARSGQPSNPPELFAREAEECADFWSDYELDFTTDSLARLDDAVDERFESRRFVGVEPAASGSADARAFERAVRSFGSYCGETLVRDAGWEWVEHGDWHVTDGDETVDPFAVATDVFRSETSFTSVRD